MRGSSFVNCDCIWHVSFTCVFDCGNRGVFLLSFIYSVSRWKSFKRQMLTMRAHSNAKGSELKRPSDSIYSFPCPSCMCRVDKTVDSRTVSATWWRWHRFHNFVSFPCMKSSGNNQSYIHTKAKQILDSFNKIIISNSKHNLKAYHYNKN